MQEPSDLPEGDPPGEVHQPSGLNPQPEHAHHDADHADRQVGGCCVLDVSAQGHHDQCAKFSAKWMLV